MRVVVLHDKVGEDARQDEVDSLVQANAVSEALAELGHEPVPLTFSLDVGLVSDALRDIGPDVVFNLVEAVEGLGRFIYMAPGLLDCLGLPYTGSSTEAVFLTSNKLIAKRHLKASGISTPPWVYDRDVAGDVRLNGGPFIIKSVWEHASIGLGADAVIHVSDPARLCSEMDRRREQLGGDCFAEIYIEGREFNLSLLAREDGPEVLPPAEIHFASYPPGALRIVDYDAKWNTESFAYHHTPRSFDFSDEDNALVEQLIAIARDCWKIFDLHGYARVDFRVDSLGKPWVLEVNANPCLSPDGGFVAAAGRAGWSFTRVIERIMKDRVWGKAAGSVRKQTPNTAKIRLPLGLRKINGMEGIVCEQKADSLPGRSKQS
jgi:D-alanine-D-alanine ligase